MDEPVVRVKVQPHFVRRSIYSMTFKFAAQNVRRKDSRIIQWVMMPIDLSKVYKHVRKKVVNNV
jgi:hypothetical protein